MKMQDFIKEVKDNKSFKKQFILNVDYWNEFNECAIQLNWEKIKFSKDKTSEIPNKRGIYSFAISNDSTGLPLNSYVMYVGITGYKKDSSRTLRQRFKEYLKEQELLKRPLVSFFLNQWKGYIYFHYIEVDDEDVNLLEIEKLLCKTLLPPANQNDFDGDMKKIVKEAFK